MMETYSKFKPTQFDYHITVDNQETWFVAPVSHNRDSGVLTRANWDAFVAMIGPESEDAYQIHRFGHWGPGWFEIILINPANEKLVKIGNDAENALADYPVLDDELFSQMEMDEANEVWANCYDERERLKYIRKNRSQFDFHDFLDLWKCVKGEYFAGYAGELIG